MAMKILSTAIAATGSTIPVPGVGAAAAAVVGMADAVVASAAADVVSKAKVKVAIVTFLVNLVSGTLLVETPPKPAASFLQVLSGATKNKAYRFKKSRGEPETPKPETPDPDTAFLTPAQFIAKQQKYAEGDCSHQVKLILDLFKYVRCFGNIRRYRATD